MRWPWLAMLSAAPGLSGCGDRAQQFTQAQFEAARAHCQARDAYRVPSAPDTIGFHGTSDKHRAEAACLRTQLAGTGVKTVVLGSRLYAATGPASPAPDAGHDRPAAAR